jgi:hypothetical protein
VNAWVARLFLLSAASGLLLYVLRATQFGVIFTDWTRQVPEAIFLALPGYAAILGMVVPSAPISAALLRSRVGPSALAVVGLACAVAGVTLFFINLVAGFHAMWNMYMGPFGLDAPAFRPLLPENATNAVNVLGPTFISAWIAITSIQLGTVGLARAIVAFGIASGVALIAVMPYLGDFSVYERVFPVVFLCAMLWFLAVGVSLLSRRGAALQRA